MHKIFNIDIPVNYITKKRECIDRDYLTKGNTIIRNLCKYNLIILILSISLVSASQVQLLCLNNGETLKFSQCNPLIPDRTCSSTQGCQLCTTYTDSGVYCPANINVCNSIENINCTQLQVTNPENQPPRESPSPPSNRNPPPVTPPIAIRTTKADIAYVVKDNSGVDNSLIAEFTNAQYTYEIIQESKIQETNFSLYHIIIVGNQRFANAQLIPIYEHKSIIINSFNYYKTNSDTQLGLSRNSGSASSPSSLTIRDITNPIANSIQRNFNAYNIRSTNVKTSFLKGEKPRGINIVVSTNTASDAVVATFSPGTTYLNGRVAKERAVFFGITEARYWTQDTKELFKNTLSWLVVGVDLDRDGFFIDQDCNDHDPTIHITAQEIPYDNIDQDCDGKDLNDLDRDGFPAAIIGGSDCDDTNPSINPSSLNPRLNCVNDPPVLTKNIENIVFDEDTSYTLDLTNYFSDPDSTLSFTVSGNSNIQITIRNSIATLTPKKDWFGTEKLLFTASDGQTTKQSNELTLTISDKGESPIISEFSCKTEINEDETYFCSIEASNIENDPITFSVGRTSKLSCSFTGTRLTYTPELNYNGVASCELIASDKDGSDLKLLRINVLPINDYPILKSSSPVGDLIKIPENVEKRFAVNAEDVDSNIKISWFLNNIKQSENSSFQFKKQSGLYFLKAIISDSLYEVERSWNVLVSPANEFTCSEIGRICQAQYICPIQTIATSDSQLCCSVECIKEPPSFKDAEPCETINNSIEIDIKSPESSDKPKIGDTITADIEVKNLLDEDKYFEVEVHLYDLDEERSLSNARSKINVDSEQEETIRLNLDIPDDIDLKNNYALFVKAEDNECSQKYLELGLNRPANKLEIVDFILQDKAVCGEFISPEIKAKNLGSSDQEISISLFNKDLKINEVIKNLKIEEYGKKDRISKVFSLQIPQNTKPDKYTITATISGEEAITKSETIEITDCKIEQSKQETKPPQKLELNKETIKETQEDNNLFILALMVFTTFVALAFLFFAFSLKKK